MSTHKQFRDAMQKLGAMRSHYMQQDVDNFNKEYSIGEIVNYTDDLGMKHDFTIDTPAKLLEGHTPVVWLRGKPGCVAIIKISKYRHFPL